jgi:GNAT superfamily N-acetyltransferase
VTIDDMTTSALRIERVGFTEPVARQLVAQALADLGARYGGEGDETPVEAADFEPPNGAFLVAYRGEKPVGCGGWRSHGDGTAELKRMYTVPAARGTGVATAVLAAIEADARRAGRTRVILETGGKQPEAIALYGKLGYRRIPNYGYYADEPDCLSFARDL